MKKLILLFLLSVSFLFAQVHEDLAEDIPEDIAQEETQYEIQEELRETGSITVLTNPAPATVLLNRRRAGNSPITASDLASGEYNIMILRDNYEMFDTTLTLSAGQDDTLYVDLLIIDTTLIEDETEVDAETDEEESIAIAVVEEAEKKKKKADNIGLIVFLSVMLLLIGIQEYNRP